jgi:hypothetical protein
MHAAAVGTDAGAVLLVGRGGSGKSTTALLALGAGLNYLGDDYCALNWQQPHPVVQSVYSSAKFFENSALPLPPLRVQHGEEGSKPFAMLAPDFAAQLPQQAPIRAVLLPSLGGQLELEPIGAQAALLALAPSTLFQLRAGSDVFKQLGALVQRVPCYRLHLGAEPSAVAPRIRQWLEAL